MENIKDIIFIVSVVLSVLAMFVTTLNRIELNRTTEIAELMAYRVRSLEGQLSQISESFKEVDEFKYRMYKFMNIEKDKGDENE